MIVDSYRAVFSNRYLATKIYNAVHQIQIDRSPLKYDDIVDVCWMLKYGHVGLVREKIKRNEYLYVKPKHLFSIVANTDTQMFIYLFEKNKYYALEYYDRYYQDIFLLLENPDVVRYLFQNGYARDLSHMVQPQYLDIKVLSCLLENQWIKPTPTFLVKDYNGMISTTVSTNYKKEYVDLVAKYTPSPIQHADIQVIMKHILDHEPGDFLFDALSPLFVKDPDTGYQQTLEILNKRRKQREVENTKKDYNINSTIGELLAECNMNINEECCYQLWRSCISQGDQAFFVMWKSLPSRIVVSNDAVFHLARDFTNDPYLSDYEGAHRIKEIIVESACRVGSLKILEFLYDKGLTLEVSDEEAFHRYLIKKRFSQEEPFHEGMEIEKFGRLYYSCMYGSAESFNYLYPLFGQELIEEEVLKLFETCLKSRQYHMIRVLESHDLLMADYVTEFFEFCDSHSFSHLLDQVDMVMARMAVYRDDLDDIYLELLDIAFKHNDLIAAKHIFNKHKFASLNNLTHKLDTLENLAIVDYIYKNRSQCFTEAALNNNCMQTLFDDVFNKTPVSASIIHLVEYLVQENCIDINMEKKQLFFDHDSKIEKGYKFYQVVYLIDHRNYSSIDPFIDILMNDGDWLKYLEYIYRNQDKFQNKPSFQSPYFQSNFKKLTTSPIQR
ncbi:hypothetical protein CYY_005410 [Polysphondylium violaceum]|uniref:Ankyrin repeat protein n=1 Tax=Polysphondylium violaceum TaxID=133409 RepID=A0A8J4PTU4_9MYCE|nr:hypothetical protein CYY_005410 [Polysphondylium violaceum]